MSEKFNFSSLKVYDPLVEALGQAKNVYVNGIVEEATGHFLYSLVENLKRPVFVVAENEKKALDLYEEASYYMDLDYFPNTETIFQNYQNLDLTNASYRMKTIVNILEGKSRLVVSHLEALNKKISAKGKLVSSIIHIDLDSQIDTMELASKLVGMGYERRNIIQGKKEFSIRGDIVDIFPLNFDNPVRIELFDTDVDSIRLFNIEDQMSISTIDRVGIYPANENILDKKAYPLILEKLKEDLTKVKDKMGDGAYDNLLDKFGPLIDQLENQAIIDNMDLILPYLEEGESLVDYLAEDSLVVYDDISRVYEAASDRQELNYSNLSFQLENGEILPSHINIFYSFEKLLDDLNSFQLVNISPILKRLRLINIDEIIEIRSQEPVHFNNRWQDFVGYLDSRLKQGARTIIFARDKKDQEDIFDKLTKEGIYPTSDLDRLNEFGLAIVAFELRNGFSYIDENLAVITSNEIFGSAKRKRRRKTKKVKDQDIINYTDLEEGDLIVHENYGIGRYLGIRNIEVQDSRQDYLEIAYRSGDKLFIPTSDMSLVSKFVGSGDKLPRLSKLNSVEWSRTKYRAQKSIDQIAENLVELYAKRAELEGFAFSPDTPWQREFEQSFIYEETYAQLRAMDEIKKDMEKPKPMDRLLCGDVGYGKTELALRAAFKAIMDGKQVVMLAPTTILVKQHFSTMKERFKNFPINVDYLSRFKSPSKAKEVRQGLRQGTLDFVVGTHALLSDKVEFKDLGLLIIDEEQRFGVKHKEKIKEMSTRVDVLTLSATPIPRTLQMSLSGIREMSLLDEPPENRLPVNTYVMEFNPAVVREAIIREMARRGQVYFVYNSVKKLDRMANYLEKLVPEARIAKTHGRMSTRELEKTLDDFVNKEYDVLVTTTIIETGMDIQNVNTIIVYNADKMGLSQLYQLKGRIGRGDRTSFAYFTFREDSSLTEISEKRLKAIKDFNELGSGYKIAMRDLELRGAGNLLGESQSGHIEQIGYDLYVRMLKKSIDKIKGHEPKKEVDVKIDVDINAYIPDSYIEDSNEKINIYKKISSIENEDDYFDIIDELIDRFGDIPESVQNVIDVAFIKALMVDLGIKSMLELEKEVQFKYTDLEIFNLKKLKILSKSYKDFLRFDLTDGVSIFVDKKNFLRKSIKLLKLMKEINEGDEDEEI